VLEAILGREIAHGCRLLRPRVPDHRVVEVVAHDVEARAAGLEHRRRPLRDGGVDAVDLAADGERVVRFGGRGAVEDFVFVGHAEEAGDGGCGDVL